MAGITLEVQSAKLTAGFGDDGVPGDGKWSIRCRAKLAWPERLELGTGEELGRPVGNDAVELKLNFRETKAELVEWATERTKAVEDILGMENGVVCGTFTYYPEYSREGADHSAASIAVDLFTPPEVMASLIRFAENGRFVREVNVTVRGLDYGYAPDGREKRWLDNAERNILPVTNVEYELPVFEGQDRDFDADEITPKREPRTPVGADLAPALRELVKMQTWTFWLLAAIGGAVIFKGWGS